MRCLSSLACLARLRLCGPRTSPASARRSVSSGRTTRSASARSTTRRCRAFACHVSQARTGGIKGALGLAEDPSHFSIACRQIGPITTDIAKLPHEESVYSEQTLIFFKHTHVFRIVDKKRNTLVYVALNDKIIEGSPQNSLSTVPIMPWGK
jgi:catabolite regulation protein CreA